MPQSVLVKDDITDQCGWAAPICPTAVTSADGTITVTNTGTPQAPVFDIGGIAVDINVVNFSYNAATNEIILTETDGTVHTIDVSNLVDVETITTLANTGFGNLSYTNETGAVVNINVCDLLDDLPDVGLLQCV